MASAIPNCPRKTCVRGFFQADFLPEANLAASDRVVEFGRFYRKSDSRWIKRFRCLGCARTFSTATTHSTLYQKKRRITFELRTLLCSGVSMRRAALILGVHQETVAKRMRYLALQARIELAIASLGATLQGKLTEHMQLDEMLTSEHTKCKPLNVAIGVCAEGYKILGIKISQTPANSKLKEKSERRYGKRRDLRDIGLDKLMSELSSKLIKTVHVSTDNWKTYPVHIKNHIPRARHARYMSRKSAVIGQGELKMGGFDPLFAINHTCAMIRANVNRLQRKTWCTTKRADRLLDHLLIFANYYNSVLLPLRRAAQF